MKRLPCLLLGLLLPGLALAASDAAPLRGMQASMVLTGTITVNSSGGVQGYTLDQQDKLPPVVVAITNATVSRWKFKPVTRDGIAVSTKTDMSFRVIARPTDAQHAALYIASAAFGQASTRHHGLTDCAPGACLTNRDRKPPEYPVDKVGATTKVSGTVYLVLEVDHSGHVVNEAIRQVNLGVNLRWYDATVARRAFSKVSLAAARDWTFNIPTTGEEAAKDHWIVVVPIAFWGGGLDAPGYGQWNAYFPGAVQNITWAGDDHDVAANGGADAVPDGVVFNADPRFVLLTPLRNAASSPDFNNKAARS